LNFAKPVLLTTARSPPPHWHRCSFSNTLSLDSHIRICAVDIRFARCLSFSLRLFLLFLSNYLGVLDLIFEFHWNSFSRSSSLYRIYIHAYIYEYLRIYPVPFARNVWRTRVVYTTTPVKYKMYNVHTPERLQNYPLPTHIPRTHTR